MGQDIDRDVGGPLRRSTKLSTGCIVAAITIIKSRLFQSFHFHQNCASYFLLPGNWWKVKSAIQYIVKCCFVPQFSLSKNQLCSQAFVHGWSSGEVVKAAAPSQIILFQISGSNMDGENVQGESFALWYVWKGFYENKSSRETHTCPQRWNA